MSLCICLRYCLCHLSRLSASHPLSASSFCRSVSLLTFISDICSRLKYIWICSLSLKPRPGMYYRGLIQTPPTCALTNLCTLTGQEFHFYNQHICTYLQFTCKYLHYCICLQIETFAEHEYIDKLA